MTRVQIRPSTAAGRVPAPSSKSYTHRFLLAAHLSGRRSRVRHPLVSDDTDRSARALQSLGSSVRRRAEVWTVTPARATGRGSPRVIDCGESGTTLRLLTAMAALQAAPVRFEGSGRLPVRPMRPLLRALSELGAEVRGSTSRRSLPFELRGPIHGGTVDLEVGTSSQFTSALLFALPTVQPDSRIRAVGQPVSEPYVRATLEVLQRHGVRVHSRASGYVVPGGQQFRGGDMDVPGDASSAAYLWAAAALTGGRVAVDRIPERWPQADLAVLGVLRQYGAHVDRVGDRVTVEGDRHRPIRVNLDGAPDLYPLVGVLAASAPGSSEIRGAAHVAQKESNRKVETVRLARAMGAKVRSSSQGLAIEGTASVRPLRLERLTDHRLVMSATVASLIAGGPSVVGEASAVRKSFPRFFEVLRALGGEVASA